MSRELIERTEEILKKADIPDRHTYFQIEKFIIGKETTAQSQLWQIIRELNSRKETVDSLSRQLGDADDNIELLDIKVERGNRRLMALNAVPVSEEVVEDKKLDIKECEINIRKLQRERDALIKSAKKVQNKLKCIMEEMSCLIAGFDKITAHVELKPLDDEESQREMWNEKMLEEFNLRVLLQRPLEPEFIKTVLSLDDNAPVKNHVVALLQRMQQQILENSQRELERAKKIEQEKNRPQVETKSKIRGPKPTGKGHTHTI